MEGIGAGIHVDLSSTVSNDIRKEMSTRPNARELTLSAKSRSLSSENTRLESQNNQLRTENRSLKMENRSLEQEVQTQNDTTAPSAPEAPTTPTVKGYATDAAKGTLIDLYS